MAPLPSIGGERCSSPQRPLEKLGAPLRDLVRVNVKLLGQLRKRPLSLDGCKRHLYLKGRAVIPARSSGHGLSSLLGIMPIWRESSTYRPCSDFPSHLCSEWLHRARHSRH